MFIGRDKEIQQIKSILDRDEKNAILIYGKRRIGKSFLITEIMKSYECILRSEIPSGANLPSTLRTGRKRGTPACRQH